MVTFSLELNSRPNRHGLYTVFIRVTENRKKRKVNSGILVPKEHYNAAAKWGRWIRTINPKHAKYNSDIEDLINALRLKSESLISEGLPVLDFISTKSDSGSVLTIKSYLDKILEDMKIEKSYIYYKSAKSKFTRFQNFVGDSTPLISIDTDHIQKFKVHLIETKVSNVTVNNIMKRIRHAFVPALRTNKILKDPFRAYDTLPEIVSSKQRLSDDQIKKLEGLNLRTDRNMNWPYLTRNMYLFSYYNAGIRVADLIQIRNNDISLDGRLSYEMNKTGHKKSIALSKHSLEILKIYHDEGRPNDFLFPVLDNSAQYAKFKTYAEKKTMGFELREKLFNAVSSKTSQINNNLKILSDKIGLEKSITFHTARHSFADKARRSMKGSTKITMYDIKNALGHSSITTTERYMSKFDEKSLDEAMGDIFDS